MPTSAETFTQHTQALTALIERFRSESLTLEEAIALFEEGVQHIKASQALLNKAQGRFQSIQEALGDTTNT